VKCRLLITVLTPTVLTEGFVVYFGPSPQMAIISCLAPRPLLSMTLSLYCLLPSIYRTLYEGYWERR